MNKFELKEYKDALFRLYDNVYEDGYGDMMGDSPSTILRFSAEDYKDSDYDLLLDLLEGLLDK